MLCQVFMGRKKRAGRNGGKREEGREEGTNTREGEKNKGRENH